MILFNDNDDDNAICGLCGEYLEDCEELRRDMRDAEEDEE